MKIREMLEREEYIDKVIKDFSGCVKYSNLAMDIDGRIVISVDTARRIAECLDWLQEIFTQNINSFSVYEVSIESLPEMR